MQPNIGIARGRRCYYCREAESIETGALRPWKPAAKWILLCDACVPRYRMRPWRRLYIAVVRWWKMRRLPKTLTEGAPQ